MLCVMTWERYDKSTWAWQRFGSSLWDFGIEERICVFFLLSSVKLLAQAEIFCKEPYHCTQMADLGPGGEVDDGWGECEWFALGEGSGFFASPKKDFVPRLHSTPLLCAA